MKNKLIALLIISALMTTMFSACIPYFHKERSRHFPNEHKQRREQREGMKHY